MSVRPPTRRRSLRLTAAAALLGSGLVVGEAQAGPVPSAAVEPAGRHELCGELDLPETGLQGDVPRADQQSGRAGLGYNCGLSLVGHTTLDADGRQATGNANMAWAGECAYVAGPGAVFGSPNPQPGHGVAVVDVREPEAPRHVRTLRTPGSVAALETLHAVETPDRAVLVVGQYGNQAGGDKPMDVYDVSDCADPVLLDTVVWPENIHNLTISGNGRYVYATQPLQVMDIEPLFDGDPATGAVYLGNLEGVTPYPLVSVGPGADLDDHLPREVREARTDGYTSHEAWPSPDGTKLYLGGQLPTFEVFTILDISDWLDRDEHDQPAGPPQVISQRSGRGHSVRTATIGEGDEARRYVLHSEESVFGMAYGCLPEMLNPFAGPAEPWLTDITDEADPVLVTQFGLEINDPLNCPAQLDSRVNASVHYHDVDDEDDTTFAMLSMWNAGLRVFDVRDPAAPVEVAYFNPGDVDPGSSVRLDQAWGHVRYRPETGHIWFATSSGGFWVVELQPQVRDHLDLDADDGGGPGGPPPGRGRPADPGRPAERGPEVRHPRGRPGTEGADLARASARAVDVTPWYCTLGAVESRAVAPVTSALSAATTVVRRLGG